MVDVYIFMTTNIIITSLNMRVIPTFLAANR